MEIVDSHLPGYVYLELRYLITECIEHDKYLYSITSTSNMMMDGMHQTLLTVKRVELFTDQQC